MTSNEKKPKRSFSPQFRAEAVQLVVTTGRPVKHVADELGIADQSLGLWVKQFNAENEARPGPPLSPAQALELKEALTENARLRMENEFLNYSDVRIMPMFA
ncbi:transposase [Cryobacterium sp. TMT1-3]|uniref:transposase n=1 Tax=Cryobacterium sp. TMT1-3 TaxID=1259237 RepID=UPI00141B15B8|nr:transposase [Cryobacterium sp. TMT1-3]